MGGKICFARYQSVSGFRVELAAVTSDGAKARLAADSWGAGFAASVAEVVII